MANTPWDHDDQHNRKDDSSLLDTVMWVCVGLAAVGTSVGIGVVAAMVFNTQAFAIF